MQIMVNVNKLRPLIEKAHNFDEVFKDQIWDALREAGDQSQRQIVTRMPVRTGRAKRSWGRKGANVDLQGAADILGDTVKYEKRQLRIKYGGVPYIRYLNQGNSQQAPAGFIDHEMDRAVSDFIGSLRRKDLFRW